MNQTLSLLIVLLVGLTACQPEIVSTPSPKVDTPTYLFRYVYRNFAWGATHQEWLIGTDGHLYEINGAALLSQTEPMENWAVPTDTIGGLPYLSAEQMASNLSMTLDQGKLVEERELLKLAALIPKAARGNRSERSDIQGYDMGGFNWYAYRWDETAQAFEEVFLKKGGTILQHNKSSAAKKLVRQLEKLKEE
ncbi:MAG: hypothetical protein AAF399_24725 [Bacteroidota bacterium]